MAPTGLLLAERTSGWTRRILLADDDTPLREIIAGVMRDDGYDVLEAATGAAARLHSTSTGAPIALLIIDLDMPGVQGENIVFELNARLPGLRIVAFSNRIPAELRLPAGTVIIAKPFAFRIFRTAVEALLREG